MIEMSVVVMLILIISAMALLAYMPTLQDARFDSATRQVVDQLRQAREYAITNRRYVQVTFPIVVVAGKNQYEVVLLQRNDLTAGAGTVNPVLSTIHFAVPRAIPRLHGDSRHAGRFCGTCPHRHRVRRPKRRASRRNVVPKRRRTWWTEPRFSQLTEQCSWVFLERTQRRARSQFGRHRAGTRLEGHRSVLDQVLKEIGKMWQARKWKTAKGFTLLETMISLVVLGVGVLGLAAMLADSLAYMQGSEYDFIAQQKAEEAAEAIYTAKYTNNATFAQLSNNTTGNPAGLFLVGPQPLLVPGADGLVGSVADAGGNPAYIVLPGPDGKLGTADDVYQSLGAFTRTIAISPVAGYTNSLNQVVITVNYNDGSF